MKSSSMNRPAAYGAIVVLLVAAVYLQHVIDPQRHQFEPKLVNVNSAVQQLPVEFALGAATGFREAIAGLLWVRTDEFFDDGDYEAIPPMVRIITWLDPHDIDVYETGAWHMDYNFTDSDQRSDRRYIPVSLSLMQEGIANNPNEGSMYSDLAFTHEFRKIEDFPQAVYWYEQGQQQASNQNFIFDVTTIGHGLAHAYLACGETDKAIDQWKWCIQQHEAGIKQDPTDFSAKEGLQIALKNYHENLLRKKWRQTMTKPPVNVHFDVTVTRIAPMVLMVTGQAHFIGAKSFDLETGAHQFGEVDGCRIEIRLQDADYQYPDHTAFSLGSQVNPDVTIMQDEVSVRNGAFHKKIDMSKDHYGSEPMYPFKAGKYTMTFWFDPACENDSPIFVADRIGPLGQGLATDQPYIDLAGDLPGTPPANGQQSDSIPGLHLLKKTITLTQDDIMSPGLATFH
jgi:hypothetical protein